MGHMAFIIGLQEATIPKDLSSEEDWSLLQLPDFNGVTLRSRVMRSELLEQNARA